MWEDSGYKIYEIIKAIYIEQGINDDIGAPEYYWLEIREALELIKVQYYKIENQVWELYLDVGNQLIK